MNRTFTLCFSLYPIALPFGYVLIYTFYHYAVPDANSNLTSILPFNNTIKDFNDAASFGIYCGLNLVNSPRKGHITVLTIPIGSGRSGNSGYCRQLAFPVSSNTIYARYRDDGVWKAWVTLHS